MSVASRALSRLAGFGSAVIDRAEQRAEALKTANARRLQAAELRAEIKAAGRRDGAIEAARVVREAESSMTFFSLVKSVPWIGETQARRMLADANIREGRRVNDDRIDGRRRELLAGALMARATRPRR
jgi:hypothetical protein